MPINPDTSLRDWLKSWPLALLPHQRLSRIVRSATRWRIKWWKNLLIRVFVRHFGVDLSEAQISHPGEYPDFNSFFTRALRPGVRQIPLEPQAIACPVDGSISQLGDIRDGSLLQAKGCEYSLQALLGGNAERAAPFRDGEFMTLYLSPRDYHRIHMPVTGRLRETCYVPGRLFSVAPHTTRAIPGLFTRNERLCAIFETASGPMAMVLVGAIFVSCMETVWEGVVNPTLGQSLAIRQFPDSGTPSIELQRGQEMGRFNMGSTVILLYGHDRVDWLAGLQPGDSVQMGDILGWVLR
ncbi:MAG TPA: archaetidylserine decarboxylase [Gammaproteobacteria bacterium]|nr:archaetidylserine decarboxylase [Gammaproteobacteria bacterium]